MMEVIASDMTYLTNVRLPITRYGRDEMAAIWQTTLLMDFSYTNYCILTLGLSGRRGIVVACVCPPVCLSVCLSCLQTLFCPHDN